MSDFHPATDDDGTPAVRSGDVLPAELRPMRARSSGSPLPASECCFEPAWDGLRVLVGLDGMAWCLRANRGQEVTEVFPELADLRRAVHPYAAVLDGELIIERDGKPDSQLLARWLELGGAPRLAARGASRPVGVRTRPVLYLCDILRIGESWLLEVTWEERRQILEAAVESRPLIRLCPVATRPAALVPLARRLGLAALIAKGRRSRYLPGRRSREWLRVPLAELPALTGGEAPVTREWKWRQ